MPTAVVDPPPDASSETLAALDVLSVLAGFEVSWSTDRAPLFRGIHEH